MEKINVLGGVVTLGGDVVPAKNALGSRKEVGLTARQKEQGFSCPFGVSVVRKTEVCVVIVVREYPLPDGRFGVYLTHGTPGGAFWRNRGPLRSFTSLNEARALAEELYGVAGSGDLARVVEY